MVSILATLKRATIQLSCTFVMRTSYASTTTYTSIRFCKACVNVDQPIYTSYQNFQQIVVVENSFCILAKSSNSSSVATFLQCDAMRVFSSSYPFDILGTPV